MLDFGFGRADSFPMPARPTASRRDLAVPFPGTSREAVRSAALVPVPEVVRRGGRGTFSTYFATGHEAQQIKAGRLAATVKR